MNVQWDKDALDKFEKLIEKIPVFLKDVARKKVSARATSIVQKDNRTQITEKDMVDAFFTETPFGFHGPMKTDMENLGINYTQYGHPK